MTNRDRPNSESARPTDAPEAPNAPDAQPATPPEDESPEEKFLDEEPEAQNDFA